MRERNARTFSELELGDLATLNEAIPELIAPGLPTRSDAVAPESERSLDATAERDSEELLVGHLGFEPRANGLRKRAGDSEAAGTTEFPQKTEGANAPSSPIGEPKDQSRPNQDPVEVALADALTRASVAQQWDVVAMLARELQARREARAGVVDLEGARKRRGAP